MNALLYWDDYTSKINEELRVIRTGFLKNVQPDRRIYYFRLYINSYINRSKKYSTQHRCIILKMPVFRTVCHSVILGDIYAAKLITRRSLVQIQPPQPNLNGTIDTKVVPFFYTHKIPKIRTFCYEKKHLKNGFPFLWRAENKQRNEWVRATKRMSKGCIFLLWLHFFRFAVSLVKKAFLYRKKSAVIWQA